MSNRVLIRAETRVHDVFLSDLCFASCETLVSDGRRKKASPHLAKSLTPGNPSYEVDPWEAVRSDTGSMQNQSREASPPLILRRDILASGRFSRVLLGRIDTGQTGRAEPTYVAAGTPARP